MPISILADLYWHSVTQLAKLRHKSGTRGSGSDQLIRKIKRKTRRRHSAEKEIRIVPEWP